MIVAEDSGCPKNAWCSKKKEKDFFPGEVCPLVFLKRNISDPCTVVVMANSQSVGVDKISTFTAR